MANHQNSSTSVLVALGSRMWFLLQYGRVLIWHNKSQLISSFYYARILVWYDKMYKLL
jgi:hypothetical protein